MIQIGFIRHGTTEWNLLGRMQGQKDTPLAALGRAQAERVAKRLVYEEWEGIVSSDLIRARETADLIVSRSGIPFLGADARLRERGFGDIEGTTLQERIGRWGEHWRQLDLGREPVDSVLARWDAFLAEVERVHEGKRILIVSHGGFIEPVLAERFGAVCEEHLANTSLSIVVLEMSEWRCDLLNCTKHLQ